MIDCIVYWEHDLYDTSNKYRLKPWDTNDTNDTNYKIYVGSYDWNIIDGKIKIEYEIDDKNLNLALLFLISNNVGYIIFPYLDILPSFVDMCKGYLINNKAIIMSVDEWFIKSIIE